MVATAAVPDASDGARVRSRDPAHRASLRSAQRRGGGSACGEGVISGIPEADGIVGDLGGGSLELVRVADDAALSGISLPLGVLRLDPATEGERTARKTLRAALKEI